MTVTIAGLFAFAFAQILFTKAKIHEILGEKNERSRGNFFGFLWAGASLGLFCLAMLERAAQ